MSSAQIITYQKDCNLDVNNNLYLKMNGRSDSLNDNSTTLAIEPTNNINISTTAMTNNLLHNGNDIILINSTDNSNNNSSSNNKNNNEDDFVSLKSFEDSLNNIYCTSSSLNENNLSPRPTNNNNNNITLDNNINVYNKYSSSSSPTSSLHIVNNNQNHQYIELSPKAIDTIEIQQSPKIQQDQQPVKLGGMIKLNVGGVIYSTSLSTLCSDSSSMFTLMFSGRFPIQKEEDGSIFIDRDGTYFHYILNWLRNGTIPQIKDDNVKEYLLIEARYYQITSLIEFLSTPSSNIVNPNKFTQKEIIQLLNQTTHPIQLASADLSGLDLSGLNFRGANLRFANLEGSSLKYCNLAEANLQDANLKSCDLRYSDLSHGNLQRVQLQNSQLQYSTAISCNFSDAELYESSLQNADFQNSLLSGANLQSANLQDINLNGSKLQGTSLYKAVNVQRAKGLKR